MEKLLLSTVTLEEFNTTIREIVREEVSKIQLGQTEPKSGEYERYLSRREVAEILGISFPTLSEWTKNGTLKGYRIGTRIRYKVSELKESMQVIQKLR